MLKIVRSANPDFVLFTLSGHIDGEHAAELQVAFDGETLPIVLDLREVKRVDREVVADLAQWNTDGIKFEKCPAYLREWIARTEEDPR
jgi:anti-anti-sigma regulatory factor